MFGAGLWIGAGTAESEFRDNVVVLAVGGGCLLRLVVVSRSVLWPVTVCLGVLCGFDRVLLHDG